MPTTFKRLFGLLFFVLFAHTTLLAQEVPVKDTSSVDSPAAEGQEPEKKITTEKGLRFNSGPNLIYLPPEVLQKMNANELSAIVRAKIERQPSVPEMMFQEENVMAFVVFTSLALTAYFFMYYSYRKRRDVMETIQAAIKSGQTLPDSFIAALEQKRQPSIELDLRKALLLIALGVSAAVMIYFFSGPDEKGAAAVGVLPTLLGCAYLFLWRMAQNKARRHDSI